MNLYDCIKSPIENDENLKKLINIYALLKDRNHLNFIYDYVVQNDEKLTQQEIQLYEDNFFSYIVNPSVEEFQNKVINSNVYSNKHNFCTIYTENDMLKMLHERDAIDIISRGREIESRNKEIFKKIDPIFWENPENMNRQGLYLQYLNENGISLGEKEEMEWLDYRAIMEEFQDTVNMGFHLYSSIKSDNYIKLYINVGADTYEFANIFKQKCKNNGLEPNFKTTSANVSNEVNRCDSLCIYIDNLDLMPKYIEILEEIKNEKTNFVMKKPMPTVGVIDGDWIGIGTSGIGDKSYNKFICNVIIEVCNNYFQDNNISEINESINNDPYLLDKIREDIINLCKQYGVSEKICVTIQNEEIFKRININEFEKSFEQADNSNLNEKDNNNEIVINSQDDEKKKKFQETAIADTINYIKRNFKTLIENENIQKNIEDLLNKSVNENNDEQFLIMKDFISQIAERGIGLSNLYMYKAKDELSDYDIDTSYRDEYIDKEQKEYDEEIEQLASVVLLQTINPEKITQNLLENVKSNKNLKPIYDKALSKYVSYLKPEDVNESLLNDLYENENNFNGEFENPLINLAYQMFCKNKENEKKLDEKDIKIQNLEKKVEEQDKVIRYDEHIINFMKNKIYNLHGLVKKTMKNFTDIEAKLYKTKSNLNKVNSEIEKNESKNILSKMINKIKSLFSKTPALPEYNDISNNLEKNIWEITENRHEIQNGSDEQEKANIQINKMLKERDELIVNKNEARNSRLDSLKKDPNVLDVNFNEEPEWEIK